MDPGHVHTLLRSFVGDKSVLHNRGGEQSSDGVRESVCSPFCQRPIPVSVRRRDGAWDAEIAPEMEDTPALPPQATSEETRQLQMEELSIQMPANDLPTVTHQ